MLINSLLKIVYGPLPDEFVLQNKLRFRSKSALILEILQNNLNWLSCYLSIVFTQKTDLKKNAGQNTPGQLDIYIIFCRGGTSTETSCKECKGLDTEKWIRQYLNSFDEPMFNKMWVHQESKLKQMELKTISLLWAHPAAVEANNPMIKFANRRVRRLWKYSQFYQ